jgi:glycosyltransferase involved in cell wall biosynthesis
MAQGLAPLTTPVGSIGEVVCDGVDGLLVSPGNSDELVAGLTRLVTDERLRNRIGAAARARAGGLGLDGWYADLAKLWNRLASTKRWARTRNC